MTPLLDALELQRSVVHQVGDLDRPSHCEGWTVGQVLNHSVGVTQKFTAFASGETDAPRTPPGDLLGTDHRAAVDATVEHACAAWASVDLRRNCRLPFGTFTAEQAAAINLFDVLAHAWDVAASTGIDLDDRLAVWGAGLDAARQVIGRERDLDHYGPELPVPPGASPMHRLLAYLGYRS